MIFDGDLKGTGVAFTAQLTNRRFGCSYCLSEHEVAMGLMQDFRLQVTKSMMGDFLTLAASWSCPVWGRQRIETPRDWWESFKERWFPARALKRWPVRKDVYEVYEGFPEVVMATGHRRQALVFYNGGFAPGPAQSIDRMARDEGKLEP